MSELKKLTPEQYEELDSLMKETLVPEKYLEFKKDPDVYRAKIKSIVEGLSPIVKRALEILDNK